MKCTSVSVDSPLVPRLKLLSRVLPTGANLSITENTRMRVKVCKSIYPVSTNFELPTILVLPLLTNKHDLNHKWCRHGGFESSWGRDETIAMWESVRVWESSTTTWHILSGRGSLPLTGVVVAYRPAGLPACLPACLRSYHLNCQTSKGLSRTQF